MMKTFGSGVRKITRRSNHKTTNVVLPARGIEDGQLPRTLLILFTNFLKKIVLLHEHTITVVETELPSAVLIPREDNTKQVRKNGKTNEAEREVSKIMTIIDRKGNWESEFERHMRIEIGDKNRKSSNWSDETQLGKPFEEHWKERIWMLSESD